MSFWADPIKPAIKTVNDPKSVISHKTLGAFCKKIEQRINKKTPAVTIVAAWISAETGVGPSIASGNQVCRPIWADLPTAPINKKLATSEVTDWGAYKTSTSKVAKSTVSKIKNTKAIPLKKNKSPTLLTKNALVAALPAWARVDQKPMSRYEQIPTPYQPKNKIKKFPAETRTNIKNVNKLK